MIQEKEIELKNGDRAPKCGKKCSCPIYWATVPDKSGNYKNFGVKGFQNAQN